MERNTSRKWRRRLGFTLVELIVVIAVLAILAGVGAVAYSGYIDKANEAADLALLGAVNESFQSALIDESVYEMPEKAAAPLDADKTISAVNYGAESTDLTSKFMKYYEGNEDKPFKVYTALGYDPVLGFFGKLSDGTIVLKNGWKMAANDNGDGTITYTVTDDKGNKYEYTVDSASMETYGKSTFGQNMSASGLMKDIDNVAETFANFLKPPSPFASFADRFAEALGVTLDKNDPDYYKKLGNAMVLGVAGASFDGSFDAKSVADKWKDGNYNVTLDTKNLNNTAAQLALAYALATGYANSPYGQIEYDFGGTTMTAAEYYKQQTESFSGKSGMDALQAIHTMLGTMMSSEGYKEYYAASGQTDVDGYLGALDVINDNRDTLESGNNVVNNTEGFSDDDLGSILDALFGGN